MWLGKHALQWCHKTGRERVAGGLSWHWEKGGLMPQSTSFCWADLLAPAPERMRALLSARWECRQPSFCMISCCSSSTAV